MSSSVTDSGSDLNPAEKFWSWLRRKLRSMDLADLRAKRAPVSKAQLQARVRTIMRTEKAKVVASNCARGLRPVWKTGPQYNVGASFGFDPHFTLFKILKA